MKIVKRTVTALITGGLLISVLSGCGGEKKEALKKAIADTLAEGKPEINLDASGCYETPQITSESPEIQNELKKVEELCKAEVTYNFHGTE